MDLGRVTSDGRQQAVGLARGATLMYPSDEVRRVDLDAMSWPRGPRGSRRTLVRLKRCRNL